VVEPPKRVLIEEEICTRLDGCPIKNNICVDCYDCEELVGVSHRRCWGWFYGCIY